MMRRTALHRLSMGSRYLPTSMSILLGAILGGGTALVMHYPEPLGGTAATVLAPATSLHSGRASAPRSAEKGYPSPPCAQRPLAQQPAKVGREVPNETNVSSLEGTPAGDAGTTSDPFTALPTFTALAAGKDFEDGTQRCAAGEGVACLRLALSYANGTGAPRDAVVARRLRQRAIGILVSQCHDVDAAACLAVGRLYKDGIGLQPSERSARALLERARMLCEVNPKPPCDAVLRLSSLQE